MTAPLPPERTAKSSRWQAVLKKLRGVGAWKLSAILCIGLPTLLTIFYYGMIAADRYVTEVRFEVRGSGGHMPDVLSAIGIPGTGGAGGDAHVVQEYIGSREIIDTLQPKVDLRAVYARPEADWLAALDPDEPIEQVVKYWRKRVDVSYDMTTGITTLQVAAFRPEDAVSVARGIIDASEALVNRLSERSRRDAVALAETELARAEHRLGDARAALTRFRDASRTLDPARSAAARVGIISELEGELAKTQAELSAARSYLKPTAPIVVSLESKIVALKKQVQEERTRLAGDGGDLNSGLVSDYERLVVEREFAERLYTSTLTLFEAARADAARKQRYLVAFVQPQLPEYAEQPRRLLGILTVFAASLIAWGIGALGVAAVKDHAGWV